MLKAASEQSGATILLGINGGFGNADWAELRIEAVHPEEAVIDYACVKTGAGRAVPALEVEGHARETAVGRLFGQVLSAVWGELRRLARGL